MQGLCLSLEIAFTEIRRVFAGLFGKDDLVHHLPIQFARSLGQTFSPRLFDRIDQTGDRVQK